MKQSSDNVADDNSGELIRRCDGLDSVVAEMKSKLRKVLLKKRRLNRKWSARHEFVCPEAGIFRDVPASARALKLLLMHLSLALAFSQRHYIYHFIDKSVTSLSLHRWMLHRAGLKRVSKSKIAQRLPSRIADGNGPRKKYRW